MYISKKKLAELIEHDFVDEKDIDILTEKVDIHNTMQSNTGLTAAKQPLLWEEDIRNNSLNY